MKNARLDPEVHGKSANEASIRQVRANTPQRAVMLRRKEKELAAYRLWVEMRSFTRLGEHFGFTRQYARQLALGGWRIEVRSNRDAAFPGRRRPRSEAHLADPLKAHFPLPSRSTQRA